MTFIGYEQGTKGYRFWSQTRMRVVISQNAVFDECFFPHCPKEIQNKPPSNQDLERQQRPDDSSDEDDDDDGHPGLPPQTDSQPDPNVTPRPPTPRGQPPLPPRRTPTPPPPRRIPTPPPQSKRRVRIQTPSPPPRVPTPPVEAPQAPAQRPTWIRPNLPPRPQTLTKNHPKAQIRVQPQRIRKPYVKPGSVYGDKTPVEIERDIRTEKEFVERILKEGFNFHNNQKLDHLTGLWNSLLYHSKRSELRNHQLERNPCLQLNQKKNETFLMEKMDPFGRKWISAIPSLQIFLLKAST
ncbi:hypothetical protein V8E55_001336 [Tylopilus felleus]